MMKLNTTEWWFSPLFRVVGYGLLALSLFDIIDIFVPSRIEDPIWEFQMLRSLVERAPVPLLGLMLVFFGEKNLRIFKFLYWACLVVGVLFILLIPLGVSCTFRIEQQNKMNIISQLSQQSAQFQQVQDQLSKATTPEEINTALTRLYPQGRVPSTNNPQLLKTQLLTKVAEVQKSLKAQAEAKQADTRLILVKNAVKYNLGALVCGVVFLFIWSKTRKILKLNKQRG